MIHLISFTLTILLTVYVILRRRTSGAVRGWVMGMGFFVAGIYLDCIFFLIMDGFVEEGYKLLLQGLGVLASKSIMTAGLLAAEIAGYEPDGSENQGSQPQVKKNADRGRKRKTGKTEVSEDSWQYMDRLTLCISFFFLMLAPGCLFIRFSVDALHVEFAAVLLLMLFLAILLVYYMSLYLYQKKQRAQMLRSESEVRKHEADIYLESVENNYQRTRELWHDLKNHISLLSLLLSEGKYEQMADYLRIFGEDVDSLTLPVKSGNLVVDALLADKLAKAKKERIEIELSLCDLTELCLKPDEVCSLFGNLLDNALEANRQVAEGRFIVLECRAREDCYYIKVKNATSRRQEGGLLSAKSDRKNQVGHGLGLRSMERIAHSCGGELAVDSRESQFTAVVRLPRALQGCPGNCVMPNTNQK